MNNIQVHRKVSRCKKLRKRTTCVNFFNDTEMSGFSTKIKGILIFAVRITQITRKKKYFKSMAELLKKWAALTLEVLGRQRMPLENPWNHFEPLVFRVWDIYWLHGNRERKRQIFPFEINFVEYYYYKSLPTVTLKKILLLITWKK